MKVYVCLCCGKKWGAVNFKSLDGICSASCYEMLLFKD